MGRVTKEAMPEHLLIERLSSMARFLREGNRYNEWHPWRTVYCWSDWGDYVWDLLSIDGPTYFGMYTRMYPASDPPYEDERQIMVCDEHEYGWEPLVRIKDGK